MHENPENTFSPQAQLPDSWIDLALYLGAGWGGFVLLSLALQPLLQEISMPAVVTAYSLNVLVFVGVVYFLGLRRGKLTWAELGIAPPRWNWQWLLPICGLTLVLMPLRSCLGIAFQYALEGNLESLQLRQDIFSAGGISFGNFVITLVFAGLLIPFAEELFFRGLLFIWFRRRFPLWVAVLASSLLFGLGHFDAVGVVVASLIIGIVNALLYERTHSLWVPIAVHAINNSVGMILVYLSLVLMETLPNLPAL